MNTQSIERAFQKMGARVQYSDELSRVQRWAIANGDSRRDIGTLQLNVRQDKHGEYFTIWNTKGAELEVLHIEPKDRHLLLLSREGKEKHRYLLGHDERHWFVAGVPENARVSTVRDAKEALKPHEVQVKELGIGSGKRNKRQNDARVRQGEWFFIPTTLQFGNDWKHPVLRDEPIVRSRGGKPHICQYLYRANGTTVYVSRGYQDGLTQEQYDGLDKKERESQNWQVMKRDMDVWVRGTVRHPDHKTITLNGWHQVLSNTEHLSHAMRNIRFLD